MTIIKISMILFIISCIFIFLYASTVGKKQEIIWSGKPTSIEYLQGNFSERSKTIIRSNEGTFVINGIYNVPLKKIEIVCSKNTVNKCIDNSYLFTEVK